MERDISFLITGANGQLGRAFKHLLPDAAAPDRTTLDVTDRASVERMLSMHHPQVVLNAAAYTKVDAAEADPEGAEAVNVLGPRNLVAAIQGTGTLLVHVSTDYVFAGDGAAAYKESDPTGPLSVYGKTKLMGEQIVSAYEHSLVVRTSWVFGDGQNFIGSILRAAASRPVLQVVDDQVGLPTYAPDLAEGILALVANGSRGLYHLAGGGDPASWAGLARFALEVAGSETKVEPVSTQVYFEGRTGPIAPRPSNSVLDCSKASEEGVALRDWREAVRQYVGELEL